MSRCGILIRHHRDVKLDMDAMGVLYGARSGYITMSSTSVLRIADTRNPDDALVIITSQLTTLGWVWK
jgi:hypothetical protein